MLNVADGLARAKKESSQVAFENILRFTRRLAGLEGVIAHKREYVLGAKAFYVWINKYHASQDEHLHIYLRNLKARAIRHLKTIVN
jgi:hypothetical protein